MADKLNPILIGARIESITRPTIGLKDSSPRQIKLDAELNSNNSVLQKLKKELQDGKISVEEFLKQTSK